VPGFGWLCDFDTVGATVTDTISSALGLFFFNIGWVSKMQGHWFARFLRKQGIEDGDLMRRQYDIDRTLCTVRILLLSGVFCAILAGCSGPSFDRERFAENTARYATKPLHKALYMNTVDFALYQKVGGTDVQAMLTEAEQDCKQASKSRGVDPERCAPLYMEDHQLLDPTLYQ
jgi:hypothetical protein